MIGLGLSLPVLALRRALGLVPPPGLIFLVDADGALLVDRDGAFLTEPA